MECNNECSAFTINIGSSCIHSMKINSDGNVIKMRSGCFKVIKIIKINSSSSTFKRNIFLTKILAYAPLKIFITYNYSNHLY